MVPRMTSQKLYVLGALLRTLRAANTQPNVWAGSNHKLQHMQESTNNDDDNKNGDKNWLLFTNYKLWKRHTWIGMLQCTWKPRTLPTRLKIWYTATTHFAMHYTSNLSSGTSLKISEGASHSKYLQYLLVLREEHVYYTYT
jgi:hypothetical protein